VFELGVKCDQFAERDGRKSGHGLRIRRQESHLFHEGVVGLHHPVAEGQTVQEEATVGQGLVVVVDGFARLSGAPVDVRSVIGQPEIRRGGGKRALEIPTPTRKRRKASMAPSSGNDVIGPE